MILQVKADFLHRAAGARRSLAFESSGSAFEPQLIKEIIRIRYLRPDCCRRDLLPGCLYRDLFQWSAGFNQ